MDDLPNDTCLTFVEKLGTIQLDKITSVMGKKKRSEYGEKAIDCLVIILSSISLLFIIFHLI